MAAHTIRASDLYLVLLVVVSCGGGGIVEQIEEYVPGTKRWAGSYVDLLGRECG